MRLIDADALVEKYNEKYTTIADCLADAKAAKAFEKFCIIADAVEDAPTIDAVPVVQCKDCRYCCKEDDWEMWCMSASPACLTTPEDYCSHGRKNDG